MIQHITDVASSAAVEYLRWSLVPEVGPVLFARLVERFGSAQAALSATRGQLDSVEGIGPARAAIIARGRDEADVAHEMMQAQQHGVRILCREDEAYPAGLRHLPDGPIVLYVRGTLQPEDAVAMALVGSRRCTQYGREQARRFGYQLAAHGFTVVSGLARGIDAESHRGALDAGGRTLAVLGNGLATIYPSEHQALADEIAAHGAILSELPMATAPSSNNFLPRNRLIAGLSLGVLVVEAAKRSGSLTTARLASEYNREVFAVPGRVDIETARGTNALIRDQHAKLVTCVEDVLSELGEVGEVLTPADAEPTVAAAGQKSPLIPPGLNADEQSVFGALASDEKSLDAIAVAVDLSLGRVATALISLQLRGLARQMPGNLFIRAKTGL